MEGELHCTDISVYNVVAIEVQLNYTARDTVELVVIVVLTSVTPKTTTLPSEYGRNWNVSLNSP